MSLTHQNYHRFNQLIGGFETMRIGKILKGKTGKDCLVLVQEFPTACEMILEMGYVNELASGQISFDRWIRLRVSEEVERIIPLFMKKDNNIQLFDTEHQNSLYLQQWLTELEQYAYQPEEKMWELHYKPKQPAAYFFKGRMLITQGVHQFLTPTEVVYFHNVLLKTAKKHQGIDYLQCFRHPTSGKEIWAIDALSQAEVESGNYSKKQLEDYHTFTLLLPSEY